MSIKEYAPGTAFLDRLAGNGLRFNNMHTQIRPDGPVLVIEEIL